MARDGTSAELGIRAHVVQASDEAWDRVKLSLSTANLRSETKLPELTSLRIGRRQPAKPTLAWREPPTGAESLFEGLDLAVPQAPIGAKKPMPTPRPIATPAAAAPEPVLAADLFDSGESVDSLLGEADGMLDDFDEMAGGAPEEPFKAAGKSGMSDRSGWTNQEVVFARALGDMLIMARVIAEGALLRDECRGVQYKPEFDIPAPKSDDPAELQAEAEQWCRAFAKKNEKWLKTTVAEYSPDGPKFSYEEVDTSLIPPRPRTYVLKGAEVVTETWKKMTESGELAAQPAGANAST